MAKPACMDTAACIRPDERGAGLVLLPVLATIFFDLTPNQWQDYYPPAVSSPRTGLSRVGDMDRPEHAHRTKIRLGTGETPDRGGMGYRGRITLGSDQSLGHSEGHPVARNRYHVPQRDTPRENPFLADDALVYRADRLFRRDQFSRISFGSPSGAWASLHSRDSRQCGPICI